MYRQDGRICPEWVNKLEKPVEVLGLLWGLQHQRLMYFSLGFQSLVFSFKFSHPLLKNS